MTKDEIKKALKCCQDYDYESCVDCPYRKHSEDCTNDILKDALALITEQEQEIERLKANGYRSIMDAFENNRDKIVENIQTEIDDYKQSIKQAKIDVLNELKEKCGSVGVIMLTDRDIDDMIEELKK